MNDLTRFLSCRALRLAVSCVISWVVFESGPQAAPVSSTDAKAVVERWLQLDPAPLGADLTPRRLRVYTLHAPGNDGQLHLVFCKNAGCVVVAGDDRLEPIIAFLSDVDRPPPPGSPLRALLMTDVVARRPRPEVASARGRDDQEQIERIQQKWDLLLRDSGPSSTRGLPTISDMRVAPLLDSLWGQSTVTALDGSRYNVYNFYTPNNYVCGCVATAMAQIMRFHEHPTGPVGTASFDITVDGNAQVRTLRGGDGNGGAYDWDLMPPVPQNELDAGTFTGSEQQMIGALCHDAGVAVNMQYRAGFAGAFLEDTAAALKEVFGYDSAWFAFHYGGSPPEILRNAVRPSLAAGLPVLVSIIQEERDAAGGHAVVCDGYGYQLETFYAHLNMGWKGSRDMWYAVPDIDSGANAYDTVDGWTHNIYPAGGGEIIAGRVVDTAGDPLENVILMARTAAGSELRGLTDEHGVYAIPFLPSDTDFTVSAELDGYTFPERDITTGTTGANTPPGNRGDIDFVGVSEVASAVWGTVRRRNGAGIPGCTIELRTPQGALTDTAVTDDAGFYFVQTPQDWSGSVLVSRPDYRFPSDPRDVPAENGLHRTDFTGGSLWYVDAAAGGAGTGLSWQDAFVDLQDALAVARGGDDVWVAAGTYKPTTTFDRYTHFEIPTGVHVYGGFQGGETAPDQRSVVQNETVLTGDINTIGDPTDNTHHVAIMGEDAVLDGFTICDGYADSGVSGRYFRQRGWGGGVLVPLRFAQIRACTFRNNHAFFGGALSIIASAVVEDCAFTDNTAATNGGAICTFGSWGRLGARVSGCVFQNNTADTRGGAAALDGRLDRFENCVFQENSGPIGGAAFCRDGAPVFASCTFTDNGTDGVCEFGGAAHVNEDSTPVFQDCTFDGNEATDSGGAIHGSDTELEILECSFSNNTTINGGGALALHNVAANVDDTEFHYNRSNGNQGCGGGAWLRGGDPRFDSCDFAGNAATDSGGAVHAEAADLRLSSSTLSNNLADQGDGGAVLVFNGDVVLTSTTFDTNQAGARGGATFTDGTVVRAVDCGFSDNESGSSGGAMHVIQARIAAFLACTFEDNTGSENGGGVVGNSSSLAFSACEFARNACSGGLAGGGGGLYSTNGSQITLAGVVFSENTADGPGAGFFCRTGRAGLTNCVFRDNATLDGGGALYVYSAQATVDRTVLYANTSQTYGGGAVCSLGSELELSNCVLAENSATTNGGALWINGSAVVAESCTAVRNSADAAAGGIYGRDADVDVVNSIFRENGPSPTLFPGITTASFAYSCLDEPTAGDGNVNDDPLLVDVMDPAGPDGAFRTDDDGLRLSAGSPCIDAGDSSRVDDTDILYNERTDDAGVDDIGTGDPPLPDLGAYERQDDTPPDDLPPGPVRFLHARESGDDILLRWLNPGDPDVTGVVVVRQKGTLPATVPTDGISYEIGDALGEATVAYVGDETAYTEPDAERDVKHCYMVVPFDEALNYGPERTAVIRLAPINPIIYVDNNADGDDNGSSWEDAFTSLADALADARSGQQIWVTSGVYRPETPAGREAAFHLVPGVSLYGGFDGTEDSIPAREGDFPVTILSGNLGLVEDESDNCFHVVIGAENAVLNGFTIMSGNADGSMAGDLYSGHGAGMLNVSCNPTVAHCRFINNTANRGAAMANVTASPTVEECTFSGNAVTGDGAAGGAVFSQYHANPLFERCKFRSNTSTVRSGACHAQDFSRPAFSQCLFSGNTAAEHGGGLGCFYGSGPTVVGCVFVDNTGTTGGGGVQVWGCDGGYVVNSLFYGNDASFGGGLSAKFSETLVVNCTFHDNSAGFGGGAYSHGARALISNTIAWGNAATTGNDVHGEFDVIFSCLGNDLYSEDAEVPGPPLFADSATPAGLDGSWGTADDGLRVLSGSPCIDTGNAQRLAAEITHDITGESPRITGSRVDLGAFEGGVGRAPTHVALSADSVPENQPGAVIATLAIDDPNPGDTFSVQVVGEYAGLFVVENLQLRLAPGTALDYEATSDYTMTLHVTDSDGLTYERTVTIHVTDATDTWFVDADAPAGGDGASWATAFRALQAALDVAVEEDEIRVADGTYRPTVDVTGNAPRGDPRTRTFLFANGVVVRGGFSGRDADADDRDPEAERTILSGDIGVTEVADDNAYHVVTVQGAATLNGLWIQYGRADGVYPADSGGGLYAEDAEVLMEECVFANNQGTWGGAVALEQTTPRFDRCRFVENSGDWGAAVFVYETQDGFWRQCRFFDNASTASGGAVYLWDAVNPRLACCVLARNSAANQGGALFNHDSAPVLAHCVFHANRTSEIGATGGGVYNRSSAPTVMNSTFTDNVAAYRGGAMAGFNATPHVVNSIFWNNTSESGTAPAFYDSGSGSVNVRRSCVSGRRDGSEMIAGPPGFVDATDADGPDGLLGTPDDGLRLAPGAACVDAGDDTILGDADTEDVVAADRCTDGDESGVAAVDVGAYERAPPVRLDYAVDLFPGWNLVALTVVPDQADVDEVFEGSHAGQVWTWPNHTATQARSYIELSSVAALTGCWVYRAATTTAHITVPGYECPAGPLYRVTSGWNLVVPGVCGTIRQQSLILFPVWQWSAAQRRYASLSPDDPLQRGNVYWILATRDGIIRFTSVDE